jgi:CRP-like cAMP-binding protein
MIYRKMLKSKNLMEYDQKGENGSDFSSDSEFDSLADIPANPKGRADSLGDDDVNEKEDSTDPPKWIIRESGATRFYWDLVVISMAVYTSITTPFFLAFNPSWSSSIGTILIDWIVNIIFIIDIGVNFRTTYINTKTGKEIWEPKLIAKKYLLGGKFWIDLLSSIPFDGLQIEQLEVFGALGMLKLIRTARISKIIQHLNVSTLTKTYLKTVQLLFNLLLFIHLQACIWWLVVTVEENWVPTMDYIFYSTELYNEGLMLQYWSSMYHSVMLFGVNEMASRTQFVLISSSFIMLFSAMVNANMIGQVAVLIGDMSKKTMKFQQQQDTSNTAMQNMLIPGSTRWKVREYLLNTQSTQDQQEELNNFLKNVSPSLRFKVSVHIFDEVLHKNEVFSYLLEKYDDEVIQFVVRKLEIMLTIPEDEVVVQNKMLTGEEKEVCMYFIAKGEFNVFVQAQVFTQPTKFNTLSIGDHFGEISMIYGCERTCTVTSNKYGTLGSMQRSNFKEVVFKYQEIIDELRKQIYEYDDDLKLFKEYYIRQVPYFKYMSTEIIHHIIFSFKTETFEKGHKLITEEDLTDKLIVVQYGVIDIEAVIDDQNFVIERLNKGCVLNYRNFLYKDTYKLVARCKSTTQVLYLDDVTWESLLSKYEDLNEEFQKFIAREENSEENISKLLLDYILPLPEDDPRDTEMLTRTIRLTNMFKNCAVKLLLISKKNKPPKLKDILREAVAKMKLEGKNKKTKQVESESIGSENDPDEYQTNFFRDASDEIASFVEYTSDVVNEFEKKLM